ncbi:hypothetical protein [Polyangium jinanense]|uniref:Uncharacterized protein n=1 Tax=Polyangium jinanense TaxID=2829994 RepID=A0A9X3XGQ9_9BACT|nr:hypothetical protein [Polyangium jinanense]MDC3957711.1 hypothetical protein [Polyangium jinanense]MDC3987776.1 hypothetical protein [Polyangium jinanense]
MADPYIDQYETLAYGRFAVAQILALVIGLDPEANSFVKLTADRLAVETDTMEVVLKKAGALDAVTYKVVEGKPDVVGNAKGALRRLVAYAESREKGEAIVADILHHENMSTVLRRRPVKLVAALDHALTAIEKHKANLPEYANWAYHVAAARDALAALNEGVRKARVDRREATPETEAARLKWLRRYSATKLIVEGILKPLGKTAMMPEIFDDLAEVHRAEGVSDAPAKVNAPPRSPK